MASSKPTSDIPAETNYNIQTLPQLHYAIEHAPSAHFWYKKFSWNELRRVSIDGAQIFIVETKSWAILSNFFLNRGYRVMAEWESKLVTLFHAENTESGKQKALKYWENIQSALKCSSVVGNHLKSIESREWGYYQEPTAVITGPTSFDGQSSCAEFYQTVYYGTVRDTGSNQDLKLFYESDADEHPCLHIGIAQCAIASKRFLSRTESVPFLRDTMPSRINYINEMEKEEFIRCLAKNVDQCYTSYLRYLRSSMDSIADGSVINEKDKTAIRKTLVSDLFRKYAESDNHEEIRNLKKYEDRLNGGEKEYLEILRKFELKLQSPPKNQNEDILLFIHGFNNSLTDAILRASLIACDIGFAGRLAVFSWPSLGGIFSYTQDSIHQLDLAMPEFYSSFLPMLCHNARKVHIIAHSKGAMLFTKLGMPGLLSDCEGKVGQVILGHGDVPMGHFEQVYDIKGHKGLKHICDGITVYYHPQDTALKLACKLPLIGKNNMYKIGRQDSEGDKLPNDDKLDNINISKVAGMDILKHSIFIENKLILEDMSEIIHKGTRAHQRQYIQIACKCHAKPRNDGFMQHINDLPSCTQCNHNFEYVLGDDAP